jgi:hypothetical protein
MLALPGHDKRAARVGVAKVMTFERNLPQGCGKGSKNASFEIRKATRSHAFGSPVPGEHMDV